MPAASTLERQMLDLINQERASLGLNPLRLELRLNASAEGHSRWMLDTDIFSHTGVAGSNPWDRMQDSGFTFSGNWSAAENIAWQSVRGAPGLADDVIDLHNGLMNSPGHRANILDPNVTFIGIGIEVGDYGGYEAVMVTQNFASTSAPVQVDNGGSTGPTAGADRLVLTAAGSLDALAGDDVLTGSAGNDRLWGNDGNDTVAGEGGNDSISGGKGSDKLFGGAGDDRIGGSSGDDRIDGGAGNDVLVGHDGNDVFVFGQGRDVVRDFDEFSAAEDIDLRQASGITSFADLRANHMVQRGADVLISDAAGNTMLIQGALIADLDATNFLF